MPSTYSPEYDRIRKKIAKAQCVILDGGVSTEIERAGVVDDWHVSDQLQWGSWALTHAPQATVDVHRSYVDAGCDLISTNTWAVLSPPDPDPRSPSSAVDQAHWMDSARLGIRLARQAVREGGREGSVAVAFSINGDDPHVQCQDTLDLLNRVFEEDPPDLILLETLSLIRDDITYGDIEMVQASGIPVWLSFRRCRH
ncbi:MAG: homocysteine S-methyltransferase family protein, partial [Lentisphaeria bacterium]|nr:homocysteine S-methyltransferase family protein [Lentisphaeria bacterium]